MHKIKVILSKKRAAPFKALIFLSAILSFIFIFQPASSADINADNKVISSEIYKNLESLDSIRVYIKFKEPQARQGSREIESIKSNQYKEQTKALLGKNKINYEKGSEIYAEINSSDLEELKNNPSISLIEPEGQRRILLQDSVPLINATKVHNLTFNGLNLTGSGRSICVIDTGINSSHPAFTGKVIGGRDFCANNQDCSTQDGTPEDLHGHGTHVAGIAAASSAINGVAIGANLVILKACNSTGTCYDAALSSSINWCVDNAAAYNISVISMSLGSGLYSDYCIDPLADEIDNAVSNNIPMVIAAGNDGSATEISAPACVQNAIPIGSIRKNDATFDYNRNSLVQLLAPGVSINSSCLSSNSQTQYCVWDGTSMATPHAAGAIAILAEYLNLTGQSRTPAQIESILNSTGKRVYDSGSGLNYSRINVFSALVSLDNDAPNVTLLSPSNNSAFLAQNITFVCNATDLALKNMSFQLWNSSHSLISSQPYIRLANSSSRNLSSSTASSAFTVQNLSETGTYNWNCLYTDYNNSIGYSASNYSVSITSLEVSLFSPVNNLFTSQFSIFTCNASSSVNLQNSSLYVWNSSSSLVNVTNLSVSGTSSSSNFSFNFTYDSLYYWNCIYTNINNFMAFSSSNFSITYDTIPPVINVTAPLNSSWQNLGRFNASLNENGSCLYSLTQREFNYSLSTANNQAFNASNLTLTDNQTYFAEFFCNDTAGNLNMTKHFTFNTEMSAPNVSIISPSDGYSASGSTADISFGFNVSEGLNISSCSLILNGAVSQTNSSILNKSAYHNITGNIAAGSYTWGINCTDEAGNIGNSSLRSLTITAPPASSQSSSGGGGGGGGGGAPTASVLTPSAAQLSSGFRPELKKEDKVKITLFDEMSENHTLIIENIAEDFVNITIRSKPVNFLLGVSQSIKLNLTSSYYYNLLVRLDEIKNEPGKSKKAMLTIQIIREAIPDIKEGTRQIQQKNESKITAEPINEIIPGETPPERKSSSIYIYWILLVIALSGLIIHWIDLRRNSGK